MSKYLHADEAATAVEYAIMVALIAIVILTGVAAIGSSLDSLYGCVATKVGELPEDVDC